MRTRYLAWLEGNKSRYSWGGARSSRPYKKNSSGNAYTRWSVVAATAARYVAGAVLMYAGKKWYLSRQGPQGEPTVFDGPCSPSGCSCTVFTEYCMLPRRRAAARCALRVVGMYVRAWMFIGQKKRRQAAVVCAQQITLDYCPAADSRDALADSILAPWGWYDPVFCTATWNCWRHGQPASSDRGCYSSANPWE